jgi:hypothetical protein
MMNGCILESVRRKQSTSKAGIARTLRYSVSLKVDSMLQITKSVSKKVTHPQTQKEVARECKVSFNAVDPSSEDWIDDALVIAGGDASLAARIFNFGLWSWLRQQETNKLGKVDEVSKGLAKAISGYQAIGFSAEEARTMILANPDLVAKLGAAKFEQFVATAVDNFSVYQLSEADEKGNKTSRFPNIVEMDSEESTETKPE